MKGVCVHAALQQGAFKLDVQAGFAAGGVTAILGGSGAGKSTLLRLIAGLEKAKRGHVVVNGELWVDTTQKLFVAPQRRSVGFMFQDYALFDHMSVAANIAYGLKGPRKDRERAVERWLTRMQLEKLGTRSPETLSGGQRQRVALARALATDPSVLLMDEPFSAIDGHLKSTLIDDLRAVVRDQQRTVLMVTHNVSEARAIADNIGVMAGGRLVRLGGADEVFDDPRAYEAALMIGWQNLLPVVWASGNRLGGAWGALDMDRATSLDTAWIGIRPERIRIEAEPGAGLPSTVKAVREFGPIREIECVLGNGTRLIVHKAWDAPVPAPGTRVGVVLPAEHVRLLVEGRSALLADQMVAPCSTQKEALA